MYLSSSETINLESRNRYSSFAVALTNFPTADGVYTVRPAYYDTTAQTWRDVALLTGNTQHYFQARVSGDSILFSYPADFSNYAAYLSKTGVPIGAGETRTITFTGSVTNLDTRKAYYHPKHNPLSP